jgi:hypothetical protein
MNQYILQQEWAKENLPKFILMTIHYERLAPGTEKYRTHNEYSD